MTNKETRTPKQRRSIEKKERIVKTAYKLFSERGFHNTNTAEIAKEAGVSTGIIYSYFVDKKDIFLDVINLYAQLVTAPMFQVLSALKEPFAMRKVIDGIIEAFVKSHNLTKGAHEEMLAMSHSDPDVSAWFDRFNRDIAEKLAGYLRAHGLVLENDIERVHIAHGLVENFCHELIYHRHEDMDYAVMKELVIELILRLLT